MKPAKIFRSNPGHGKTTTDRAGTLLDQVFAYCDGGEFGYAIKCERCEDRVEGRNMTSSIRNHHLMAIEEMQKKAVKLGWDLRDDGEFCPIHKLDDQSTEVGA